MLKRGPRAPMPPSRRAKQFAPFDALKGLKEAIAAKEKRPEPRRELTDYMKEQINNTLTELRKGQQLPMKRTERHSQSFGRTSRRPTEIIIADLMERLNAKAFPQVRNGPHTTE